MSELPHQIIGDLIGRIRVVIGIRGDSAGAGVEQHHGAASSRPRIFSATMVGTSSCPSSSPHDGDLAPGQLLLLRGGDVKFFDLALVGELVSNVATLATQCDGRRSVAGFGRASAFCACSASRTRFSSRSLPGFSRLTLVAPTHEQFGPAGLWTVRVFHVQFGVLFWHRPSQPS
jgi:hypothetical protein